MRFQASFLKVRIIGNNCIVGGESIPALNNVQDDKSDDNSVVGGGFGPRSTSRISDNSSHMSTVGVKANC